MLDAEQYQEEEEKFRCLVLKALRTLIRTIWLFDPDSCRDWDFKGEMSNMASELNKAEAKMQAKGRIE